MTALLFENPTHQHVTLYYRIASHAHRVFSIDVPFHGGTGSVDLDSLVLKPGESFDIIEQLDTQARVLGLSYKER